MMRLRAIAMILGFLAVFGWPVAASTIASASPKRDVSAFEHVGTTFIGTEARTSSELRPGCALAYDALASDSLLAARGADDVARVFHHTFDDAVESIQSTGLRPGSYATPTDGLSPLQAHIELAFPPNGARNAVLQIDVQGLRSAGYQIPEVTRVPGQFGLPGGGYEMQFPHAIPSEFITVVQP